MTTQTKVILGVVAVAVVAAIIIKRQRDKQSKFSNLTAGSLLTQAATGKKQCLDYWASYEAGYPIYRNC